MTDTTSGGLFANRNVRHGTQSGYRTHQQAGERPCDACVRAKQEYDARWRATPRRTRLSRLHAKAQWAAQKRLIAMYPEIYAALYAEEKALVLREAGEVNP